MPSSPLAIYALTVGDTVRVSAPTLLEATLGRLRREVCDRRLAGWAQRAVARARVELQVEGLEHVEPGRTYVVMSNHQSVFDIFVLLHAFPGTLRMVAKAELFDLPVIGRAMRAAEFIGVSRGDHRSARAVIEAAKERLASGVSVWLAPEGTRSRDGRLLPFKRGGFLLARTTRTPILPVTLDGTLEVLAPGRRRVQSGRVVRVRFHAPVDPASFPRADREALVEAVRSAIASGLPERRAGQDDPRDAELS